VNDHVSRLCDLQDENIRKIFVGGLHANTTEAALKAFYQQWGELTGAIIMRDQASGRYFVTYHDFGFANLYLTIASVVHEVSLQILLIFHYSDVLKTHFFLIYFDQLYMV